MDPAIGSDKPSAAINDWAQSEYLLSSAGFILDEIPSCTANIASDVLKRYASPDEPIHRQVTEEDAAAIRAGAIPSAAPVPIHEVQAQMQRIFDFRVRMDHRRFFGFIPSPVNPVSWLGAAIVSSYDTHTGSWMQSSGPSAVEDSLTSWLADQVGLPSEESGGVFVSCGSMANFTALAVARDQKLGESPEKRATGIAYVSAQTHSSVAKGLKLVGFADSQIRKVKTDGKFRISMEELELEVKRDREAGLHPFVLIATCGTTNVGAIDPLDACADFAQRENLWLHVDGAYGASLALSKSHRHLIQGMGRADSIAWDPHKWLFQTYACGLVLVRNKHHLVESFAISSPGYVRDAARAGEHQPNFWDRTPEMSRPARAMKLWFTLQVLGTEALGKMIDKGIETAVTVQNLVEKKEGWVILSPAQMGIVVFRYEGSLVSEEEVAELNVLVSKQLLMQNTAALLTTQLEGKTTLRIVAIHPELTEAEMGEIVDAMHNAAIEIEKTYVERKREGF